MGKIINVFRKAGKPRIVLAIDSHRYDLQMISDIIDKTRDLVRGYKFGTPFIVHYGYRQIKRLISMYPDSYYIADLKLADLGDIMSLAAEVVASAGFNAIVAHSVVGVAEALDRLSRDAKELGLDLILQTIMTHPGSISTLDSLVTEIKNIINLVDPEGLIAPANKPEMIKELRRAFGWRHVILSPGIIMKGISPGKAICIGADAEIIGRRVLYSPDPLKALTEIIDMQRSYLDSNISNCVEAPRYD